MKEFNQTERLKFIVNHLTEKKGINPLVLDVKGFSNVTDYLIIVDGLVNRHVSALGSTLARAMRENFSERPLRLDGLSSGEWILIDYSDIIVHIFMPGLRERYDLEQLWIEGKQIQLQTI
jgi:ribosome-associated protein